MPREATWLDGVGGHVALDLVNTVSWRHDPFRFRDRLDGPAALATWARAMGFGDLPDATAADLARLRELREAIHDAVAARAGADWPAGDAEAARAFLETAVRAAVGRARLDLRGAWGVDVTDARSLGDHLALQAVALLRDADPDRLRSCDARDCGWVFLDTSRSGTRRWCDAAGCGNRARARRHQARHRSRA